MAFGPVLVTQNQRVTDGQTDGRTDLLYQYRVVHSCAAIMKESRETYSPANMHFILLLCPRIATSLLPEVHNRRGSIYDGVPV